MSEQRTGRGAVAMGPTAEAVASNVRRVRKHRGLSTYQLADRLKRGGRPIAASAISKLERGERKVDVDDLAALAVALEVSPSALLLRLTDSPDEQVLITGTSAVAADVAWDWANGRRPLHVTPGREQTQLLEHQLFSLPPWLRDPVGPMNDAMRNLPSLRDPQVRSLLQQLTGMTIDEPQPLPEKYRSQGESGEDG
ncbi:helix-turn-helix transcriptional regulator [Streptomyces sp. VNUA24]|uniref:helix-turn-helix domain-containing protein n=1 Tax=Streptomyces sp. VNUA24 TaxID=3031131 RepID=UPI0023B777B0|nr:helix-turn-helix transcriptional regulator [Streptomyces sp. VNUA24]WEH16855.1 helix-turn-helix transcriptional regulator [Streptomyces sp. VNUA24]